MQIAPPLGDLLGPDRAPLSQIKCFILQNKEYKYQPAPADPVSLDAFGFRSERSLSWRTDAERIPSLSSEALP